VTELGTGVVTGAGAGLGAATDVGGVDLGTGAMAAVAPGLVKAAVAGAAVAPGGHRPQWQTQP
jgi:hypothetical protein